MKVEYKTTGKFTEDCINEILSVEKEKGLTPENLVEEAKNPKNPLHDFFEWEDSIAGEKFRLQQARVLINEVKVIIENKEYYAFENVQIAVSKSGNSTSESSGESETERIYKPIVEIMNDEDLRQQIIISALNHLAYWEKQNAKFSELKPIFKSAEKVRKKFDKKWQNNKKQNKLKKK